MRVREISEVDVVGRGVFSCPAAMRRLLLLRPRSSAAAAVAVLLCALPGGFGGSSDACSQGLCTAGRTDNANKVCCDGRCKRCGGSGCGAPDNGASADVCCPAKWITGGAAKAPVCSSAGFAPSHASNPLIIFSDCRACEQLLLSSIPGTQANGVPHAAGGRSVRGHGSG